MEGDNEGGERRDDKPRGVPKAKLADVDLADKISIWYKPGPGAANSELVSKFPKAGATLFCNKIFEHFRKDDNKDDKMYKVLGGERNAFESVFAWIKDCVDQQSILKYPDIPEPEKDPLKPTVDVIVAGNILGIPAGSLGFFLEKRLNFIARKHLMSFDQAKMFYTVSSEPYKAGLRKIACASIFNAWWDYRLDESTTPELMESLSYLREDIPELDEDLHDAVKEKDAAMEKSRLERKLRREAEQSGNGTESGFGSGWDQNADGTGENVNNADFDAGWNKSAAAAPAISNWMSQGTMEENSVNVWDKPTARSDGNEGDNGHAETSGGDWADEVNEQFQEPSFVPAPTNVW